MRFATFVIEQVAEVDDELGELFLEGADVTVPQLMAAIRRTTVRGVRVRAWAKAAPSKADTSKIGS